MSRTNTVCSYSGAGAGRFPGLVAGFEERSGRNCRSDQFCTDPPPVPAQATRGLDRNRRLTRRQGRHGRWTMKTQSDYRSLSEDCVRLAKTAKDAHYRTMFLNMSDT